MIGIFNSKVLEISNLMPDVKIIRLSPPKDFEFKAGQYLSLSVMREDGKKIRKPFSISNPPKNKNESIEFCVKIIPGGLASEFVKTLKPGNEVELFGPAGKFITEDFGKDLIFIAAGVGIAPFMSMIPDLLNKKFNKKIILLKSSNNERESLYNNELERFLNKHPNFVFYNIFSEPKNKTENQGRVQDFFEKYIPEKFSGNFYICGMKEMIEDSKKKLLSLGFREKQIFYEKFN